MNEHFIGLTAGFEPLKVPEPTLQQAPPSLLVSEREVHVVLASLNEGKAIGLDMLPSRVVAFNEHLQSLAGRMPCSRFTKVLHYQYITQGPPS